MRVTTEPNPNIQHSTPKRIRFGILLALSAVTIFAFIAYLILALQWRERPFLGMMLTHTMTINRGVPNGDALWPGLEAGLEPGDQIISINGEAVADTNYQDILSQMNSGDEAQVVFQRQLDSEASAPEGLACTEISGSLVECTVSFETSSISGVDFATFFLVPFASALVVLGVSLTLFRLRPWDDHAFIAISASLLLAIYMVGIFDFGTTHAFPEMWLFSGTMLGGVLITIGLVFPAKVQPLYEYPWLRFVPLGLSALLGLFIISNMPNDAFQASAESGITVGIWTIVSLSILAALLFFYQRPRATSANARDQANALFLGVMVALAPSMLWLFGRLSQVLFGDPFIPYSIEASLPFYVTPTIALAYAVLQYRRFDTDRVISQAITYSVMLVALIIGYFLLVLGASLLTTDAISTNDPVLIMLTIFFVSLLFVPVRTTLQNKVDEVYFRTRRDFQAKLEQFGHQLTSLAGSDVMIRVFREMLGETIQPTNTLLFLFDRQSDSYVAYGDPQPETDISFSADSGVVELLKDTDSPIYLHPSTPWPGELHIDRARLGIIRVMVIAGMAGSNRLNGFAAIGPPRSGTNSYTYEELRFINNLVGQLAVAVERAEVINTLERSVQELEVLSQISQAVNFTIDFDDLLELISAQTLRLIDAPYFYIVLHNTAADQLYFAFFLENDERDKNKENKKWALGKDFYTDVIRKSQPIVLEDFERSNKQNNYVRVFEKPDISAWMSVPLAGTSTLGALAVGTSDPSVRFTADQMRIFSSIGSLAATSIEKARLFTETNIRARQLEALNDISRELVATEGDIEKLLNLITSSAVEILNAEAGSLLLVVEDGSSDLEFKTAVGGTGESLLGTRLPAGRGVVGRVSSSGQPIISNDTARDERWEGEVVKEGFHTNSVLAVPLIAKERVVGVLEVINKLDGSLYVEEDTELLTTFASQAAIAYENARLLQQTDLQLTQRVKELEALELIDRELNQTLDLNNVAEITIRWAVNNSSATAGVLGIVNEEGTHVQILSKRGYDDDDTPEGADDMLWPLDRGIVSRVMRTRRADLQPDVSIDPDYIPSLQDSLSQITVPMLQDNDINAILVLESDNDPRLNLLDLDWVQRLAEHASIAIANAQLYSELTRANETKSEFVGFAAHELKNPLSSVKGYADLLKTGMTGEISTQQRDFLNIIRDNADRMQTIIDDLRDIAKIDAGQLSVSLKAIKPSVVTKETLQAYEKNFEEKNQTLISEITEDTPAILGDRVRLVQVMTNLLSNANKYSPPGSEIRIMAAVENNHRNRDGKPMGEALRIAVKDNGIGMKEEDVNKLFRVRYFRSSNDEAKSQPGTGLGMMITQNIIHQHGGTIWIESTMGEGSTFNFTIPLAKEPEKPQEEAPAPATTEPASD